MKVEWPGQKVLSGGRTSRELTREEITKEGGLRLVKDDLWICAEVPRIGKVQNGGIRLRWKRVQENANAGSFNVFLRGTAKVKVSLLGNGAAVFHGGATDAFKLQGIPHGGLAPVGQEMLMELVCVGRRLILKRDGVVQGTQELPEAAPADFLRFQGSEVIVTQAELINLDRLSEAEALKVLGVDSAAPPQPVWVPMYRQAAELVPLFSKPKALYPFLSDPTLVQDPASGLKLAGGWLTPTTTQVKLPLPSARNAGVRLKVKMSDPEKMDGASVWLRSVDGGAVYSGNWRGIIHNFGRSSKAPEYLAARTNLVAKKLGETFTLEFYTIGTQLICRYEGDVLRISEPAANRAPGTLNHLMIRNPVTDIEFINLDGLSEAEALKLAGVEVSVTAPQPSFSWGGSRYAFVNDKVPWPEARKRAEAAGGRLAVFETEAEERAVREHYRATLNKQRYWIGGHAEKGSKEIRWITGAPVGKVAWRTGHPDWRSNPASPEAQSEGLLFAGALGVDVIQEGTDRWIIIHPEYKTSLGFILEWNDAATPGRLRAAGTMMNGRPPDIAKFAALDDFVDVAAGADHWVALRANGQTVSSDGKADFQGIRKITRSYQGYASFIDTTGGLRFHPAREMALPASLKGAKVADAACGSHHGVALLEDGRAVVFGRRYEEAMEDASQPQGLGTPRWPQPEAAALQNVKGVAVTYTHAATLHHDGTVSIWGWEGPVKWQPEPEMKPVRQISSFHDALHLLDEAGQVWSFPLPRSAHLQQPVGFNGRVKLLGKDAVRLRDHLWLNADGAWRAVEADLPTVETLKSATLRSETNFALIASSSGPKPYGYALWIGPGE